MSSSDPIKSIMQATPWALDELPMPDIFPMSGDDMRRHDEHITIDQHALNAAERTRAEADAYARGFEDAESEARIAGDAKVAAALSALNDAIASVHLHTARWTANAEENLAALAVVVARHIVQQEVTVDQSIVRDLVQRVLAQFPIDQTITVRLHPDDVSTCSAIERTGANGHVQDIRLVGDPHIERGGCLVEGRERIIDGRIDTSLERAYRSIGQVQAS